MRLHMTGPEALAYERMLRGSVGVVEYGTGGSTELAGSLGVPVVSVESDPSWANRVRAAVPAADVRHVNIGPVGPWGWPVDDTRREAWPSYSQAPWPCEIADVVLIDGRFRVACAAWSAMHAAPGTRLVIHDFDREYYAAVLSFLEVVERVETLAVLRSRDGVPRPVLERAYSDHQFDPR